MRSLQEVTAEALSRAGALIEPLVPEGLEVIAPAHVQQALSLPEWSRLGFEAELPSGAHRVTLESDWIAGLERLTQNRGRHVCLSLQMDPLANPPRDLDRLVAQQLALQNATYRVTEVSPARTRYLLLAFRLTAVSDDKAEDFFHLCVNESNSASADSLAEPLLARLRQGDLRIADGGSDSDLPPPWSRQRVEQYAARALPPKLQLRLAAFLTGLEHRMDRDLQRLHSYHSELREQALAHPSAKSQKLNDPKDPKAGLAKLEWIEREYHAKIADLRRKYSTTVEARLAQVLRLAAGVCRVRVMILRKKASRPLHVDFCGLAGTPEQLPCESCWNSSKLFVVCDESVHLLCQSCASPCRLCGKNFCRACHPHSCPRCA